MPVSDIRALKKEERAYYREVRRGLSPARRRTADFVMGTRILTLGSYRACDTLLAYISTSLECDTSAVIKRALSEGKRVAVPKCLPETRGLEFYIITSPDDLREGFYGIPEPDVSVCERLDSFEGSLCLVPGLAFDLRGFRLGFGGGYYDRFLSGFTGATAAVCYDDCVADELPADEHDMRIQALITEKKTYRFRN